MANTKKLTLTKLREIDDYLFEGLGLYKACEAAGVRSATYRKARFRLGRDEGDEKQRPHFERHDDIRQFMRRDRQESAAETMWNMGMEQEDWRAVKAAAEMAREEEAASSAGTIQVEVVDRREREPSTQEKCKTILDEIHEQVQARRAAAAD